MKVFIIILLLLILILHNYYIKTKIENFKNKNPKIAVYSYNFGNYRNELGKFSLDNFKKSKNLDYYFYTNIPNIESKKWKIIKVPLRKRTSHMNENRVTTKYYKFKLSILCKLLIH